MAPAARRVYDASMDTMPSVTRIFEGFTGYQRTAALKAAIELDVFSAIAAGAATAADVASRCGAAPRGVRSLCDRLVTDGLLEKDGDRYRLGSDAAMFLDRASPAYLGSMVTFITSPLITEAFA